MIEFNEIKRSYGERICALRDELHGIPELSGSEYETTALIKSAVSPLRLEEITLPCPTGAAFRLRGNGGVKTLCLRADIDALPVTEPAGNRVCSRYSGKMHACGHDAHAAGLFGAAMALSDMQSLLTGDVIFLFQPAEENTRGALDIAESGFLEREGVGAVFGLHNLPEMPAGDIGVAAGAVMAAKDSFEITIRGKSGHGAMPETACDPIVASAAVINAIQTVVSRSISPLDSAAVTVSSIHCGNTDNRIEDETVMRGSIRTVRPATRERVMERLRLIVEGCAAAYGCKGSFTLMGGVPAVVNADEYLPLCTSAAAAAGRAIPAAPVMISEDFAYYGAHVPAFFCFVGSGVPGRENAPLHSAAYRPHEDTPVYGAALLTNIALGK